MAANSIGSALSAIGTIGGSVAGKNTTYSSSSPSGLFSGTSTITGLINTLLPVYQTYAQIQALKAGNLPLTGLSSLSQLTGVDALQPTWDGVKKYWPIGVGLLIVIYLLVKK